MFKLVAVIMLILSSSICYGQKFVYIQEEEQNKKLKMETRSEIACPRQAAGAEVDLEVTLIIDQNGNVTMVTFPAGQNIHPLIRNVIMDGLTKRKYEQTIRPDQSGKDAPVGVYSPVHIKMKC